jgi:alkylation response protein AidB-like acyl-CoA dehydrogenase
MIVAALNRSRITIGAMAVGTAQAAFDTALRYAQERGQFSKPIMQFQGIQWKLAGMAMNIEPT